MRPPQSRRRAIGDLRRREGLSAGELGARLALDVRTVERLEAGATPISVERLLALSAALDADPLALLAALILDAPELALGSRSQSGPLALLRPLAGEAPTAIASRLQGWAAATSGDR